MRFTYFELEQGVSCQYDSMRITDTEGVAARTIPPLCGFNTSIPIIISSGNVLLLEFTSDNDVELNGFILHYETQLRENGRTMECLHP